MPEDQADACLPQPPSPGSKYEVSLKEMNWGARERGVSLPGRVAGQQHWVGIRKTSDGEDVGHRQVGDRDGAGWDWGGLALCPFPQPSAEGREQWGSSLRALQMGDWGAGCVTVDMGSTSVDRRRGCVQDQEPRTGALAGGGGVARQEATRRAIRVIGVSQGEDVWGVKATGGLHVCECLHQRWLSGYRLQDRFQHCGEPRGQGPWGWSWTRQP